MAKHPRWTRTWACIEHYQIQWKKLADLIACVVCASCWPIMLCLGQKHALSLPDLGQLLTLVACRTSLTPSRYESALDFAWPPYSLPSLLVASRSIAPLFFCSFLSSIWCMFWLLFFIFIFFFFSNSLPPILTPADSSIILFTQAFSTSLGSNQLCP